MAASVPNGKAELAFTYTRESFVEAARALARARYGRLGSIIQSFLPLAVFGPCLILFIVLSVEPVIFLYIAGHPMRAPWYVMVGFYLLLMWWGLKPLVATMRLRLKRRIKGFDDDERWLGSQSWAVSDEGVEIKGADHRTLLHWNYFSAVIDAPTSYLLPVRGAKNQWHYVPKYAFASGDDEDRFRTIVKRNAELVGAA